MKITGGDRFCPQAHIRARAPAFAELVSSFALICQSIYIFGDTSYAGDILNKNDDKRMGFRRRGVSAVVPSSPAC